MRKYLLTIILILGITAHAWAAPPYSSEFPRGCSNGQMPSWNTAENKWKCTSGSGTGDVMADGTVPFTAAPVPNAANTVPLGSAAAEWADIYLGDGGVIYGQNDQSNTLISSATGWRAPLPLSLGTASSVLGQLLFYNNVNTNPFTIFPGETGVGVGWKLPIAAPGGANYLVNADADGTLDYTDPATFATAAQTFYFGTTQVAINRATNNLDISGVRLVSIPAGTIGAGTAPLKLTSGASMTTPEAGAIEFTNDELYFTITTGPARKAISFTDHTHSYLASTVLDDTKGDGDTAFVWSADKVYDLLAGKQAAGSYQADIGLTAKSDSTSTTSSTTAASSTAVKAAYDLANGRQPALDVLKGTLTNTYLCTYTTAGTLLDCNTNPATFATAGQTFYFGTTQIAINRGSGALSLAGVSIDGTAAIATAVTAANEASDATSFPLFVTATTGDLGPKTHASFKFDASTGYLETTGFTAGAGGFNVTKQSGVAGRITVHEANSTDTHTAGFRGPASITGDGAYEGQFPNARPSSANMVLAWTNAAETGTGTATDPYVQATSWVDLDNYLTSGGALGTPSSGTLTNATGLPATGVTGTAIVKTQVFQKCTTVKALVATDDFPVEIFPYAITITAVRLYHIGSTEVVGQFDECTGASGVCTSLTTVDADITASSASVWTADDGSLTNPTIAANNGIWWHTTSVAGTNTFATMCFFYTID